MQYQLKFTQQAELDIAKHKKRGDKIVLNKILVLLEEISVQPFVGTGRPEALKHEFSGYWSRRINREHRLVYRVADDCIYVNALYGHYL